MPSRSLGGWLGIVPADFLMSRDMLHGVEHRAEQLSRPDPPVARWRPPSRCERGGAICQLRSRSATITKSPRSGHGSMVRLRSTMGGLVEVAPRGSDRRARPGGRRGVTGAVARIRRVLDIFPGITP